jgi:hypothetical protein
MSTEKEAAVVEAAKSAVEALSDSNPPPGQRVGWWYKIKGVAGLLTAIAALLASFAALYKTFDTSAVEGTYITLSASIEKLSEEERQNAKDIASLRGYLDGISHGIPTLTAVPASSSSAAVLSVPAPMVKAMASALAAYPPTVAPVRPVNAVNPIVKLPADATAPIVKLSQEGGAPVAKLSPDAGVGAITFVIKDVDTALPPARTPTEPVTPPPFSVARKAASKK